MSLKVKLILFLILFVMAIMGYFTVFPYIPETEIKEQNITSSHIVQDL